MSADAKLVWSSRAMLRETPRDAAGRFVEETFGVGRDIRWGDEPGLFHFRDGFWYYRLTLDGNHWLVHRTGAPTPRGKAYTKARRATRPDGED